jgi:hypothetical protein
MKIASKCILASRISSAAITAYAIAVASIVSAKPVPDNLGNGLNKIIENLLIEQGTITGPPAGQDMAAYTARIAKEARAYAGAALIDSATGKYLVDIMPDGRVPLTTLQSTLQTSFPTIDLRNIDRNYAGHGVLEGYIALTDAANIAKFSGVRSVILQLKPIHSVGNVTSQGIHQHRVNRINTLYNPASVVNVDGTGMSIGVMSDSYNSQPSEEGGSTTAPQDVATGDLPGTGNLNNSQPVVVLQDYNPVPGATNEGRGMCQIVADIAPKARIGFATADVGEVGFANNIRALGGLPGYTYPDNIQQGFKGDVVCDDVSYLDEPMFQDGIVAQGVIDVVNAGVTYCSSAANNWGTDGYASTYRNIPNGTGVTAATNSALVGTNINLTGVDPALYAGGFHNFNPSAGQQDVAQLFNSSSDPQAAVFQWNDPYDVSAPNLINPPLFEGDGMSTAGAEVSFGPFSFTAGHLYVIAETATGSPPVDDFDGIVRITDSQGHVIVDQDTNVDEVVTFFAPATDNYTVTVHPYGQNPPVYTHGPFHVKINLGTNIASITQDFNLLFFKTDGTFIEAVASNNFANNRPYELWVPDLSATATQVQLVIARSNTTTPPNAATQLKYVFFGNGSGGMGPAEYNDYLTPVTYGHSAAAGANSVAAYSMFRPNLPENFTSPGPVTIYFDTNNNRLSTPQVRLKPDIAAADGANNTFFPIGPPLDALWDMESAYPNFYGTSAASPHAAALAALVIQAHKPAVLTPQQVKTLMQLTAFPHDLDPFFVQGTAPAHDGVVTVKVSSDDDSNAGTGSNDTNGWTVNYSGSGYVKELHFNPNGLAGEGGNVTGGNYIGGLATGTPTEYSDFLNASNYHSTPGMVFNSNQYLNGTRSDVVATASFTHPPLVTFPASNAYYWTLNLAFPANAFTNVKTHRFSAGHAQQQDARTPQGFTFETSVLTKDHQSDSYCADILGDGVSIPEYADNPVIPAGMVFSGIITDGGTDYPFTGRLTNKIGKGYSRLDGYGFINVEAAATATLPALGVVSRKTHGSAGTFDIPLPINGPAGVECRTPGGNGSYQLVFTFDRSVGFAGNASTAQGTGVAAAPVLGPNVNQVTVNLTGVTNMQHLIVTLSNARDASSQTFTPISARMDVLVGDTTANDVVNASDVSQTKAQSGAVVTNANFRTDVTANGSINASDVAAVKASSGTGLP